MIRNKLLSLAVCSFCFTGAVTGMSQPFTYVTPKGETPSVVRIPKVDNYNAFASAFQLFYNDPNVRDIVSKATSQGKYPMLFVWNKVFSDLDKQSPVSPSMFFPQMGGLLGLDFKKKQNAIEISKNILSMLINKVTENWYSTPTYATQISPNDPFSFRTVYRSNGQKFERHQLVLYTVPAANAAQNISNVIDSYLTYSPGQQKTKLIFPKSLFVELNRFTGSIESQKDIMKKTPIRLEHQLAFNVSGTTRTYKLTGILGLMGDKMSTGHFVAYIRHGNDWYVCDDTNKSVVKLTPTVNGGFITFPAPYNVTEHACIVIYNGI